MVNLVIISCLSYLMLVAYSNCQILKLNTYRLLVHCWFKFLCLLKSTPAFVFT